MMQILAMRTKGIPPVKSGEGRLPRLFAQSPAKERNFSSTILSAAISLQRESLIESNLV